ncbi:recombination regulator RecX [Virgibacillus byunsanensis]|uniref:Regulatory protein RecX n=1 Tax=Virgibacillus byunsanensis TaxID=570945 RepID=A0ABW3LQY8_9BACI
MTEIARITTQKKRKNRYNIFLDDGHGEKYGFSVDESVLIEYKLRKGLELDDSMVTTLIQKDTLHKSYTLAINYLSYRMRTKKEIYDYLTKKEVDEEHITKIMDKLHAENLIDDTQFAEAFVETRIHTSNKGPRLVKKELMEKGVTAQIADQAVEKYSFDLQFEKAQKWTSKKLQQQSKHSYKQLLQSLQATLMQKGFSQDVIKEVLADMKDEKDDDAQWTAIQHHGEKLLRKHERKFSGFSLRNKMKEALYKKGFSIDLINTFLDESINESN